MEPSSSLDRALDEAVSALARGIEAYYRAAQDGGVVSDEVREALSSAMRWTTEASRIEFARRAQRAAPTGASLLSGTPVIDGSDWQVLNVRE